MSITPDIKDLFLPYKASLKDALALIYKNAQGICFVTGDELENSKQVLHHIFISVKL